MCHRPEEETLVLVCSSTSCAARRDSCRVQPAGGPHAGQDTGRVPASSRDDKAWAHERNYSARPVIGPRSPLPLRTITGASLTDRPPSFGSMPQSPPSSTASISCSSPRPGSRALRSAGLRIRRQDQRGVISGVAQLGEQQARPPDGRGCARRWCAVARAAGGAASRVWRAAGTYTGRAGRREVMRNCQVSSRAKRPTSARFAHTRVKW